MRGQRHLIRGYLQYRKIRNSIALSYFPSQNNLIPQKIPGGFSCLREKIDELKPLIDRDYCFLDLPEYRNIGDHMIYEGSREFLRTLPYTQKYESSVNSFKESKVGIDDLIILQGGGNFGDLWSMHQHFRERIVSSFKKNKIIVFPQTIYFEHSENLNRAVSVFSDHPDLTICTRDHRSYETAKTNFTQNTILLLPDMASYKNLGIVRRAPEIIESVLFMKRRDKELEKTYSLPYIKNLETQDWPTFEEDYFNYLPAKHKQSQFYLNEGIMFMTNYDLVISTRLHGAILATLLGIPTIVVDNSYGKNRTYYESWLNQMPQCHLASNQKQVEKLVKTHFPEVIR